MTPQMVAWRIWRSRISRRVETYLAVAGATRIAAQARISRRVETTGASCVALTHAFTRISRRVETLFCT